jgi:hypothetical protein
MNSLIIVLYQERNRQIELKAMRKMKEKQRDIYFFSQTLDASEKMRQREVAEAAERERVNHQVQKDQLAQLQQYKDRWMTNKLAEIAEGERLKQAALDLIKEQEEKDRQAELLAEKRNRENTEANIKLEKIKADIMAKEQKEIDAIAFYAAEKDRKMKERKEQEEEAFRYVNILLSFLYVIQSVFTCILCLWLSSVKQAIRQKMIDDGVARLASFKSNEDSRLAGQQAQAEAAAEARAANDRAKQEQIQRELAESRADAVARKEAEKARNRKLEKEIEELRRRELAEFNAREAAAKEAKKQAGLQNQRYLAEQINQRESDQHRAMMEREAYATELQQRNANAEEKARQYALNLVKEYAESGKNIKPLVRAVQKSMSKSLAGH